MKNLNQFKNYHLSIIGVLIFAFVIQIISIQEIFELNIVNNSMLDFYILNARANGLLTFASTLFIPLIVGIVGKDQLAYFDNIKFALYIRVNRRNFIIKRSFISFANGFIHILLYYVFAFIFLIIIMKTIYPTIPFRASMDEEGMLLYNGLYFKYTGIYLILQVFLNSIWAGLFSLIAFVVSMFISNKIIIILSPALFTMASALIVTLIPRGIASFIDHSSFLKLFVSYDLSINPIYYVISPYILFFIYMSLLYFIINKKAESDLWIWHYLRPKK